MARAEQTLYRRFYREVFTPVLARFGFVRVGQQNTWRKDTNGGVIQLIGAAAGWLGGRRVLEWDVYVPGLDGLMRADGPALPLGGRAALGYCHVSGHVSDLIKPDVLANRPDLTGDFELTPEQSADERLELQARVEATLALFAGNLQRMESLEDLIELLVFVDPTGVHRFMPNEALTPLYAAGIAVLAKSRHLDRVVSDLEAWRNERESRAPQFMSRLPVWEPMADRLLVTASAIRG
jgi:hypothetical protein